MLTTFHWEDIGEIRDDIMKEIILNGTVRTYCMIHPKIPNSGGHEN